MSGHNPAPSGAPATAYWIVGEAPRCLPCAQRRADEAGASVEGGYAIETDSGANCPDCGALLDLIVIEADALDNDEEE